MREEIMYSDRSNKSRRKKKRFPVLFELRAAQMKQIFIEPGPMPVLIHILIKCHYQPFEIEQTNFMYMKTRQKR